MTLTQINKAGLDQIALDHVFTIGASGSSAYTFQGEGLNGTVNNPTLYLTRGKTYRFENGSGGHPIRIQSTSGASGTAYNTGVTNNAGSGTVIVEVQHDAPDVLYYQCTSHAAMNGILYITGALADGGVTTAKIADDAVTDAKLANSINSAIAANTAKTTNATHTGDVTGSGSLTIANNAVSTDKLASNAVVTSKILDGAINNAKVANDADIAGSKLADDSISLAKLQHGTSSNDGKFLRANNGADPTFETVNTDLVSDTSPQLGGTLDSNGNVISLGDATGVNSNRIKLGAGNDFHIYHNGTNSTIREEGDGDLLLHTNNGSAIKLTSGSDENMVVANKDGNVELFHDGTKRFSTASQGFNLKEGNTTRLSFTYSNSLNFITANAGNEIKVSCGNGNSNGIEFWDYTGVNKRCQIDAEGIKFNADTAAANGLDEYEEGTWTPTLSGGGTTTIGGAYYTKIGRFVNFYCYLTSLSIPNNSTQFRISGLPFAVASGTYGGPCSASYTGSINDSRFANLAPNTHSGFTYIYFHTTGIGQGYVMTNAHWQVANGQNVNIQGCYITAT